MASSRLERIGTILSRKLNNDNLMQSLEEVLTEMEVDYNAMKENERKLEHLTSNFIKCTQNMTLAHKEKIEAIKDIHASFKKKVEGLLTRGGLKPDDRPLWFDVYRAFPPLVEPKFAKPKPEIKPIRQILYNEDVVRAKFHSKGLGLAPVNMLNPSGETQTKRLVKRYEILKSEGITENELIEKSAAIVENERQEYNQTAKATKETPNKPETVSAQILSEANLKNIFADK